MEVFRALEPILSVDVDILGPLPKLKSGRRFPLVILVRQRFQCPR